MSAAEDPVSPARRASGAALLRMAGYGIVCGLLLVLLRWVDSARSSGVEHSVEIWGGLIAALFAALGIVLGLRLTRRRVETVFVPVEVPIAGPAAPAGSAPFAVDALRQRELGVAAPVAQCSWQGGLYLYCIDFGCFIIYGFCFCKRVWQAARFEPAS